MKYLLSILLIFISQTNQIKKISVYKSENLLFVKLLEKFVDYVDDFSNTDPNNIYHINVIDPKGSVFIITATCGDKDKIKLPSIDRNYKLLYIGDFKFLIYGRGELSNLKLQNINITETAIAQTFISNNDITVYEEDDSYIPALWVVEQKDNKFLIIRKQEPHGICPH